MGTDTVKAIGIASSGNGRLALDGLETEETEILTGSFVAGQHWVRRGDDGRLLHVPAYQELPAPQMDMKMHPFWHPAGNPENVQLEMISLGDSPDTYHRHSSPSIFIQHLCGYNYSAENYTKQAEFLEECGFACMRSRRDVRTGQFWEIWFLPGLWIAEGPLQKAIVDSGKKNEKLKARVAVEFLRQNCQFGTLDISVQRLAMRMPD